MKGVFLFFLSLNVFLLSAQEITRDTPFSFLSKKIDQKEILKFKALDLEKIQKQDMEDFELHQQFNVARLQVVSIENNRTATWKRLDQNTQQWSLKLQTERAEEIAVKFNQLFLPKGSQLFVYTEGQKEKLLCFSAKDQNINLSHFISKTITGSHIVLEYNSNSVTEETPVIDIEGILNFYRTDDRSVPGFAGSTDCEVNVACDEGEFWCNEIESVVRILIQSGQQYSYCSGSVVNNTLQDFTPYVLTAAHCGEKALEEDYAYWRFDFSYQSDGCELPISEDDISSTSLNGCLAIAEAMKQSNTGTDFRLVKLLDSIPKAWNVYYAGWDVSEQETVSGGGVSIHHPFGDLKKISTYHEDLTSSDANGDAFNQNFWKTYWVATENGHGITEGGSSGSPLFNNEGLIIGVLSAGSSYCDYRKTHPDYYGKMAKHWDDNGSETENRLKEWLDPLNSGVEQLGGLSGNTALECGDRLIFDDLSIFPNPAKTEIRIGYKDLSLLQKATFRIIDIKGKVVMEIVSDDSFGIKMLNISALDSGVYILEVRNSNWISKKKFVILPEIKG